MEESSILAESRSVLEAVQLPGTRAHLVYASPRSRGYLSTIQLQLTPDEIPASLRQIHLRITIEGDLFEKIFEADPNLKYTYAWKGVNVYRQRVYGLTTALVKVGYEYAGCSSQIIWNTQATQVTGQDLSVSSIGGWDLDLHHRYNFEQGIVYRGDGTHLYLRDMPALVHTTMGDGHRRQLDCQAQCNGPAAQRRLLAPLAIVSAPDGSLFVGDFNLVRRIRPDGQVRNVLRLNATSVAHRYYLAVNPQSGALYVSDPESHRIMEVVDIEDPTDLDSNWRPLIGSGERCLPGDEEGCGDGRPALSAQLIYPKGVAVTAEGLVYFADGTTVRWMDQRGLVHTLIQPHLQNNHWKPLPCEGTISLEEATLRWPTELAISPLDNTVHFIDDSVVMKVMLSGHLKVVAGRPLHCSRPRSNYFTNFAAYTTLSSPQTIAFSPSGELYIAESDGRRINRISSVGTDGRIGVFAGKDSRCNCQEPSCNCFNGGQTDHLATHSLFRFISGLAITPDGGVHVCDQTNYRVRTIRKRLPEADGQQMYHVHVPESQETYVFNRFGLHMETRNMATRETLLTFAYSVSTSTGSLVSVADATSGGKITIVRNYAGQAEAIENMHRQKCTLDIDRKHLLRAVTCDSNNSVQFDYYRSSELLRSRQEASGASYLYDYDENGRLERAIMPTGEVIRLISDISIYGAMVNVTRNDRQEISLLIQRGLLHKSVGHEVEVVQAEADRSCLKESKWGHRIVLKTAPSILLEGESPGLAESFPVPALERTEVGKEVVNQLEWVYYSAADGSSLSSSENGLVDRVGKRLKVNSEQILTVELDRATGSQLFSLEGQRLMVSLNRTRSLETVSSLPPGIFPSLLAEYDAVGQHVRWSMGSLVETYTYDRFHRLKEVKTGNSPGSLQYHYTTEAAASSSGRWPTSPSKVVIPSGGGFLLQHDETGALEAIVTPRGHSHGFQEQLSLGCYKMRYLAPWAREAYVQHYDQAGRLLARVYPQNAGKVLYTYDTAAHLRAVIGGRTTIHYHYLAGTALVSSVDLMDENFHMKTFHRHHRGSVKELQVQFLNNIGLNNYTIEYQYDATGRLATARLDIPGQTELSMLTKYDPRTGRLRAVSDLRVVHRSFSLITMEDLTKSFVREKKFDEYGRFQSLNLIIRSQPLFRVNIEYNANSQMAAKSVFLPHQTTSEEMAYNANNQINIVRSTSPPDGTSWIYTHDVNGNVVSVTEQGQRVTLGYDAGDRVVQFGDLEFVTYDERGFVIRRGEQRYAYNPLGQMTSAFEPGKFAVRFYYDAERRLIGSQDHRGGVVQYMYSHPGQAHLVTHIHQPKLGHTTQLLYDEDGLLMALETVDSRLYVGTDSAGSPLAVFDARGKLVKQVRRTPFGRTMHDSNPGLKLPVDFNGGLLEEHTRLVHFGDRVYDPVLGQWMVPAWEQLGQEERGIESPFQLFVYRYMNNNPMNRQQDMAKFQGRLGIV